MTLNRRSFLQIIGLAGGGLVLGFDITGCTSPQAQRMTDAAKATGTFQPNAFISITPDDQVLVAMNKSEMGQGVMTGIATLIAEELEVPVESLRLIHAHREEFEVSVGEASIDTFGLVGMQVTGGSSSTPENYVFVRKAAASAREMLIAAAADIWGVPAKTCTAVDGTVRHPSGKQARYGQLTKRAARADIVEDPPLKKKRDFIKIGKARTRVDALDKSTGRAAFGADVEIDGKVCAYVIHPPVLGAPVVSIDAAEASKMKGVLHVLKFERGVAVVAEKYWQARRAAHTVDVVWGDGMLKGFNTADLRADAHKQTKEAGIHTMREDGDAAGVLTKRTEDAVELFFDFPYLAHATMEPMNCVVRVDDDDTVTVWAPNQSPTVMAESVARAMDINRSKVRVHTTMLGGGFGRRAVPDFVLETLLIARRIKGKAVQVLWTREDDTRLGYYRPQGAARVRGTVDKAGKLQAASLHLVVQGIFPDQSTFTGALFPAWIPMLMRKLTSRASASLLSTGTAPDFIAVEGLADTPYELPNFTLELTPIRSPVPVAFWRSVGHSYSGFLMESFIDVLAHKAGADPVAFRENHLASSPRHLQVLRNAVKISDWGKEIEEGWGRGVAVHKSFGTYVAHVVEAGLVDGQIRCRKVWCACDCGIVINPDIVRAQLESGVIFGLSAMRQKIDIVDGEVQQGNFDTYPALRMFETPEIEVVLIDSNAKPSGIGEPGLPPILPAVANAIFAATGKRLTTLPLQDAWDHTTTPTDKVNP